MDTPENYYAILGVSEDADNETLKRAYRQLARQHHPDLAGEGSAIQMKRINRAYAVLSDPEKRQHYDAIRGGVIGQTRPRSRPKRFSEQEDLEFAGLNTFCTKGPFRSGPRLHTGLGVISALRSISIASGQLIAAGTLDGTGKIWQLVDDQPCKEIAFSAAPIPTVESLRELRFSEAGSLLTGWGRQAVHVWDAWSGQRLWSYNVSERAVSAHYSLDLVPQVTAKGKQAVRMALPLLPGDIRAPRSWGVRGSDIISHIMEDDTQKLIDPVTCVEENIENRQFWAIRLRALSEDTNHLLTLSCAQIPGEKQQKVILRRWDLTARGRFGGPRPHIDISLDVGDCAACAPPYAVTPDARMVAFGFAGNQLRICDSTNGTFSDLPSGTMGSSARLAFSSDGQWIAIAREDSEINEGVIDLWHAATGQLVQKFYHPWQISSLYFSERQLFVALTDGTIYTWK
ncbi:DnaJ-like protein [Thermosporothrix hazakensis]|jgi:WD40 repeat protein|uniref:DnaJ-like protein n=2 Tax=Thermosporothrix TaxID=768650 RepID=A0A326UEB2_THEHA|nr:DnaJ domain-containing protein [Thermosporothrix hazakensis]PZW36767.1 DnaJ-like protein [Thermosporothrix hazakensis]BBH89234.1 hypothetical protein KTC_39850 [Thermosporothrix sp. COM3]GCE47417.1 hypothetical protein KTH_22860 [Thermosporothrix hazakensis]